MPNDHQHARAINAGADGDETPRQTLERALERILWEFRAYLTDIVIIGGWVPYLYQRYGPFPAWRGRLALTAEVDILVSRELPTADRPAIPEILKLAGFRPVYTGPSAAVWANEPERGEKVEFLVPRSGPYRDLGNVVPVRAQRGMGAISLTELHVLQRHTGSLSVLARSPDQRQASIDVRVPLLGAYVLNKAATFPKRTPLALGAVASGSVVRSNPKKAKDLLYLRDLMHGGPDVVAAIERDVVAILERDPSVQHLIDAAANELDAVTRVRTGSSETLLNEVGAMLVEREPTMNREGATADVVGHLTDLAEIVLGLRSPDAARPEDEEDDQ